MRINISKKKSLTIEYRYWWLDPIFDRVNFFVYRKGWWKLNFGPILIEYYREEEQQNEQ